MKGGVILILLGGLFFGCATSEDILILDKDIRQFQSQLDLLKKEEESLKKDLSTFQKDQKGIEREVSTLQGIEREVSTLQISMNDEMKKLQADLLLRIENLQSEIRILSTGFEEYKDFFKRPAKEIDKVREDVVQRTKAIEEKGKTFEEKNKTLDDRTKTMGEKIKGIEDRLKGLEDKMNELVSRPKEVEKQPPAKEVPAKEVPAEVKGASATAGDLYKDAYETFQKGNLEGARRKFEVFLKQYPNTELSDNAQFWIGETYYLKKDFEKAILEYEKAITNYPEGDKIPAALFKQALAFLELGDKTNGKNLLRRVIERYPHSDQAEMAKKRLEAIK
jgi:tol-pal system protein YbgF